MPAGRPRKLIPDKDEVIALGKELVKWAEEPPKDGELKTCFQYWYAIEKNLILKQWKALIKTEEFRPYYEKARAKLHHNMVRGDVKEGIAHRYLKYYDQELAEQEDDKVYNDAYQKAKAEQDAKNKQDEFNGELANFLNILMNQKKND